MSLVAVIYCIVIIYLPSLIEAETNFVVSSMPVIVIFIFIFISPLYLYLPPMIEVEANFVVIFSKSVNLPLKIPFSLFNSKFLQGPKRCTTTRIDRNITNAFQVFKRNNLGRRHAHARKRK